MPVLDLIAWFLLVLWALFLTVGLLLRSVRPHKRLLPTWTQAASALTLLLLAWYGCLLTRAGTETARYAFGIAAAITFHLIGGQLAAGAPAPRRTLLGVSATAIGYLLIASATAQYGPALGGVRLLSLALCLLVGALAAPTILWRTRRQDPLPAFAASIYALLLFAAAGFAVGLAITAPRFGVLAAGAFLLIISELNLLAELAASPSVFPLSLSSPEKSKSRLLPSLNRAARQLRLPGQALIVVSIWSALQNPLTLQISVFAS